MQVKPITEREFMDQVIRLARLYAWKVAHFRPAMTRAGKWVTAVQGDGAGFPDLLLLRGKTQLAVELKVGKRGLTDEQAEWIAAFHEAGVAAYCWRPSDWELIESILENS